MNWGWKIVVIYTAFMLMTLSMVFYFMRQDVDLVADDYYKQEIEYQGQIDKMSNAKELNEPLDISYSSENKMIALRFPEAHSGQGLTGNIKMYRPSNAEEDKEFDILTDDSGIQLIAVSNMSRGLWKVKISWTSGGNSFYDEKVLTL